MIHFDCDWCRRVKSSDEIWILGLAAEAVGITAARREITILPAWNRETALHPLAVHFCCEECKDDYTARLFNNEPTLSSEVVIETPTARKPRPRSRATRASSKKGAKRKRAA